MAKKKAKKRPVKQVYKTRSTSKRKISRKRAKAKRPSGGAKAAKKKASKDKCLIDIGNLKYIANNSEGRYAQVIYYLKTMEDGKAITNMELMKKFSLSDHIISRLKKKLKDTGLILHAIVILKSTEQQTTVWTNPKTARQLKR